MENIETMAIEINERTYSIAVAILPAAFFTVPFDLAKGYILVINERDLIEDSYGQSYPTYVNCWMDRVEFLQSYRVRSELIPYMQDQFVRVTKVP